MTLKFEKVRLHRYCESAGDLQFSAITQGEGPTVICLHGFPDHPLSYRHQLPAFAEAGYRAISITLRGYEPDSIPENNDYSLISIAEDILVCMDELKVEKAYLVGHDWGAAISYLLCAIAPERFYCLAAMSVPHPRRFRPIGLIKFPKQLRYSWYILFFQLRGISDFIVGRNNFNFIRWLWQRWSRSWDIPEEISKVIETFSQPGVKKASLSYYRDLFNITSSNYKRTIMALENVISVPTLAITGKDDGCIDSEIFKKLMLEKDFSNTLEVIQIENVGHFPHQENPKKLNKILLGWFARHPALLD